MARREVEDGLEVRRAPSNAATSGHRRALRVEFKPVAALARHHGREVRGEALPFPDVTEVLLLGSFFSPADETRMPDGACTDAERGNWYFASEFAERFGDAPWCALDKPWWLSPEHARECRTTPAREFVAELHRPAFVARVSDEVERAFVVPNGW